MAIERAMDLGRYHCRSRTVMGSVDLTSVTGNREWQEAPTIPPETGVSTTRARSAAPTAAGGGGSQVVSQSAGLTGRANTLRAGQRSSTARRLQGGRKL